MDKIKLFDGTALEIEDYASLAHIVHTAKSAAKAETAASKFTDENLRHVEFLHDDVINGIYDNLGLIAGTEGTEETEATPNPLVEGKTVTIALYQK